MLGLTAVAAAQYTITAPERVDAGSTFEVSVDPVPDNAIVSIVKQDHAPNRRGASYAYFHKPPSTNLRAPDEPGADYEVRLLEGHSKVLFARPIIVEGVTATLDAPESVDAGAAFDITWTGPANNQDQLRLVEPGAPADTRLAYAYLSKNPARMAAPDKPGEYELRYVTGQAKIILVSRRIQVGGTSAAVTPPDEIEAGAKLEIGWEGPNNGGDVINVVLLRSGKRRAWGYPGNGNPAGMVAPAEPGEYEVRYQTGQSRAILARAPLRVVPATQEPGSLKVEAGAANAGPSGAIEIILDASGSMLQRMGAARRIDVAKTTLTQLTVDVLPAGTPFALRVFGKEVGSCQTDLEIGLAPLNAAAVSAKISSIQAQNNAKTPIAASLAQVSADLRGAKRPHTVVLITDGEETCDGDPAEAIAALTAAGLDIRVNIVGFAIDDAGLKEQFEDWAAVGSGAYFDAADADALSAALSGALRQTFEAADANGAVVARGVAGGEAVALPAGEYTLRTGSATQPVVIQSGRMTTVALP